MFGPRSKDGESEPQENTNSTGEITSVRSASETPVVRTPSPIVTPRRVVEPLNRRTSTPSPAETAERTLKVGKGLKVAGEITSCDVLVVEGSVEAKLAEGKMLEITEAGQFRGNVEIESADIAGRFDGQLVVHGRLTLRSTGRISGTVKYGELEVSAGGQIIGEVQVTGGGVQAGSNSSFKNSASKLSSIAESLESDEERAAKDRQRKSA